jgi:uncharacterized protein
MRVAPSFGKYSGWSFFNPNQAMNATSLLRLNVGFIIHESVGYSRKFPISVDLIEIQPDLVLSEMDGNIKVTRTAEGLLVQVKMVAKVSIECVRCLDSFSQLLYIDFTDLYNFAHHISDESDLIVPENGILDMTPSIREEMQVAIPIKPLCRPDCKGLCPVCGENRNIVQCDHHQDSIDPRLESLRTLLNGE